MEAEAKAVEEAVRLAIEDGALTADLGGKKGTAEVGDDVVKELEEVLRRTVNS